MGFLMGMETLHFERVLGAKKRSTWNVASGHKIRLITESRDASFEDVGCPVGADQAAIASAAVAHLDAAAALTDEVRSLGESTLERKRAEVEQLKSFQLAASCILKISDRMLRDGFL